MDLEIANKNDYEDYCIILGSPHKNIYLPPESDHILENAYFIGAEGIFGLSEATNEPVSRSYSNGLVFPPEIRRGGKDFTLDILFTGLGEYVSEYDLLSSYSILGSMVSDKTVYVMAGNAYLFAQCQRIDITKNEIEMNKKIMVAKMYMTGHNSY